MHSTPSFIYSHTVFPPSPTIQSTSPASHLLHTHTPSSYTLTPTPSPSLILSLLSSLHVSLLPNTSSLFSPSFTLSHIPISWSFTPPLLSPSPLLFVLHSRVYPFRRLFKFLQPERTVKKAICYDIFKLSYYSLPSAAMTRIKYRIRKRSGRDVLRKKAQFILGLRKIWLI